MALKPLCQLLPVIILSQVVECSCCIYICCFNDLYVLLEL